MKRLWKKLSAATILIVAVLFYFAASAMAEESGDFAYEVVKGKATITGYNGNGGAVTIPSKLGGYLVTAIGENAFGDNQLLTSVVIPEGVTSIDRSAFAFCIKMTSIKIPASVTKIGEEAFVYCELLADIQVDASNSKYCSQDDVLFNKKTTLIQYPLGHVRTNYTIPKSVTNIVDNALSGCNYLREIIVPASVTDGLAVNLGDCVSLETITVNAANSVYASQDGVLFNKAKTILLKYPIGNVRTSYTIPSTVNRIEDWSFHNCSNLTGVVIPNKVTYIGDGAFRYNNLSSLTIPNGVTYIGSEAFGWSYMLTSVYIPSNVSSIGTGAFCCCNNLTAISVSDSNSVYSSQDGVLFNKDKTRLIQYPNGNDRTSYTIPDGVISIEAHRSFFECTRLINISFPESIDSIGECAFADCRNLVSAIFSGNAPSNFGNSAFANCSKSFTILYEPGASGWTNPWNEYPTSVFDSNASHTITNDVNGVTDSKEPIESKPYSASTDIKTTINTPVIPTSEEEPAPPDKGNQWWIFALVVAGLIAVAFIALHLGRISRRKMQIHKH